MRLFSIAKMKCHYVNQSSASLILSLVSVVLSFHAGIHDSLNKFEGMVILVDFELVSKYLEQRSPFFLKTVLRVSWCELEHK